jgi:MYXO-CTERM domain-containing protein
VGKHRREGKRLRAFQEELSPNPDLPVAESMSVWELAARVLLQSREVVHQPMEICMKQNGSRAVVIALGLALAVPAAAQQGSQQQGSQQQSAAGVQSAASRDDNDTDWGWLGLLGLIGLVGLRRRGDHDGRNGTFGGSRSAT